jgi:type I restriction enzyme R subunit
VSPVLRPERATQNRIVHRLTSPLADGGLGYGYLGEWSKRSDNRGVELDLLRANLEKRGYGDATSRKPC